MDGREQEGNAEKKGSRRVPIASVEISTAHAWLVAIAATLAMSVSYIDRQILAVLAKSVRDALSIDPEQFGYLLSAFSVAYLVASPLVGIAVDKFGARVALIASMLLWSAISASHALVASFQVLFALRIALGTAEAPSFPSAAQAIRRALPPRHRSAGYGLLFTGSSVGAMLAAPLAVAIKAHYGWRIAFLVGSVIGLAWLPFWIGVTSSKKVRDRLARPDADDVKAVSVPKIELLRDPAVLRALVLVVAAAPAIMFVLLWFPQFLEHALDVKENDIGKYAWLPPVFFDVGAVAFGAIASRRDASPTRDRVRSQPELMVIGAVLLSMVAFVTMAHTPWTAVIFVSLALVGGGCLNARLTADMIARIDPAHVSTAGGMCAAAQSLAYIIANPLIGRSVKLTRSYGPSLLAVGAIVIPGVIAWIFWPMRKTAATSSA